MSNEIVQVFEGDLRVSSEIIAEHTENQHRAVLQLVRTYADDLEAFGRVAFEMRPFETAGGVQQREVAYLNEQQSTLLITYMRNSPVVRAFKKALVTAFYQMRQELARPLSDEEIVAQALQITSAKLKQLETKITNDAPKVEYHDKFISEDDDIVVLRVVAQQIGVGEHELRSRLVEAGWIYRFKIGSRWSESQRRMVDVFEWRPYAEHAGKFQLRPQHNAPRHHNGQVQQTLYVKAVAIPRFAKRFGRAVA